ncbi:tRNA-specific adenosine deaminase 2 [Bacillus rossius redtenbacheri]|uniref:tRNA-specific adenosine deaminase 2 n=1 Tax=Bacillus rossius redtenbacheri TaxID=93214 RepID=UPI002FDDDB92
MTNESADVSVASSAPFSGDARHEQLMLRALELAREALRHGEVPVGCLFVRHGRVIAEGRNSANETRNATRHAEMNCVDSVVQRCAATGEDPRAVLAQTEVVVSVEPCVMCAAALLDLGVLGVVYGCPNDRFGGCGSVLDAASLCARPFRVVAGVREAAALQLLRDFYKGTNPRAPVPKAKAKTAPCVDPVIRDISLLQSEDST